MFPKESKHKVYCQDCWWSDKWDPSKFQQTIDFTEPFFQQIKTLIDEVPMMNLTNDRLSLVNCDYVNFVSDAKNCYLVFASNFLEDCMYDNYIWESKDTFDCAHSTKLELCYECLDCDKLFNCNYLQNSQGCTDCTLGFGLKSCRNCFGCVNLTHKENCYFNKQLTKTEYEKQLKDPTKNFQKFEEFKLEFPRKFAQIAKSENVTGDAIKNCKNAFECFDGYGAQDVKWIDNFPGDIKDCYDQLGVAQLELAVDSVCAGLQAYHIRYSVVALTSSYCDYCVNVKSCKNCFGCVGIKQKSFCIFNKQYSESEYKELTKKLIAHMKETGEWGELFPIELSPYPYEETQAQDYYPLP